MAYRNGQFPASALRSIGNGLYLAQAAALAWLALNAASHRRYGVGIRARTAYRNLALQWYFWRLYISGRGNLAAYPGTSNHGWGIAVDLYSTGDRSRLNAIGAPFGWSKAWSDAPGEWWHIRYRSGIWSGKIPFRTMHFGMHGSDVKRQQKRLRHIGYTSVKTTGYFGKATRRAVKLFQKKHKLHIDGVIGPKTARILKRVAA